ncbi:MAG: hypothetical protein OXI20_10655, partial [Rhodospirillales bacterium]|nr:hypothetical protein [Rhodospirillales bacterium]
MLTVLNSISSQSTRAERGLIPLRREAIVFERVIEDVEDGEEGEEGTEYLGAGSEPGILGGEAFATEQEQREPAPGPQDRVEEGGEPGKRQHQAVRAVEQARGRGQQRERVDRVCASEAASLSLHDHSLVGIEAVFFQFAATAGVVAEIDKVHLARRPPQPHVAGAERAVAVVEDRYRHVCCLCPGIAGVSGARRHSRAGAGAPRGCRRRVCGC